MFPQELYQKLTDYDIRYYMYELLKVRTSWLHHLTLLIIIFVRCEELKGSRINVEVQINISTDHSEIDYLLLTNQLIRSKLVDNHFHSVNVCYVKM